MRLDVVNRNAPGETLVAEHQGVTSSVATHTVQHRLPAGKNTLVWEPPVGQTPDMVAGVFLAAVQLVTLFVGTPTLAYAFLSIVLIATSGGIAWFAEMV